MFTMLLSKTSEGKANPGQLTGNPRGPSSRGSFGSAPSLKVGRWEEWISKPFFSLCLSGSTSPYLWSFRTLETSSKLGLPHSKTASASKNPIIHQQVYSRVSQLLLLLRAVLPLCRVLLTDLTWTKRHPFYRPRGGQVKSKDPGH